MALIENPELTREFITSALFNLMNDKDFDSITITDIVNKAGIGRATFYRHFKTKEDVIREYFQQENHKYLRMKPVEPTCADDYYELAFNAFSQLKENRVAIERLLKAKLELLYLDYLNDALGEYFVENKCGSARYTSYYVTGSLFNVSIQWVKNGCAESVRKITDEYFSYIAPLFPTEEEKGSAAASS